MTRVIWTRTGYMVDYVPRGKRVAQRAPVSETVPVAIPVVPEMAVAATDRDGKPILHVHAGTLYEDVCPVEEYGVSVETVPALRRDEMRFDLVRQGAASADLAAAMVSGDLDAREILRDGREDGLAWAVSKVSRLVVSGDRIMRQPECPPAVLVRTFDPTSYTTESFANTDRDFRFEDAARLFRYDSTSERHAFVDRMTGKRKRFGGGTPPSPVIWTQDGKDAEDMTAWWVLWRTHDLARRPLYSRMNDEHYRPVQTHPMDLDSDVVDILAGLRRTLEPHRFLATNAVAAGGIARDVLWQLSILAGHLEHDGRPDARALAGNVGQILAEVEALPLKPRPAPADDDEAFEGLDLSPAAGPRA